MISKFATAHHTITSMNTVAIINFVKIFGSQVLVTLSLHITI